MVECYTNDDDGGEDNDEVCKIKGFSFISLDKQTKRVKGYSMKLHGTWKMGLTVDQFNN